MAKLQDRAILAQSILSEMNKGKSLRQAALTVGISAQTFLRECEADHKLAEQYAHTREEMVNRMFDELIAISDELPTMTPNGTVDAAAVQKQRLQVDTRKWALSKLAPRKYGDRVTLAGDEENPLAFTKIERVVVGAKNAED